MSGQLESPRNLPHLLTNFIGRDYELVEINALLDDPDCRLLTLVGPGGIGKTRLAMESIQSTNFADGIYMVWLQPLTSPDLIVSAIVDALPLSLFGNTDARSQLLDYLQSKDMLLVLDNFDHLMDGVGLLTDILGNAPRVKLMVTSCERLRLREEWVYDVAGLVIPEDDRPASLEGCSATRLFIENARRAGYRFQEGDAGHIVRICRLVEGVPLAIELSASWVRTLPCNEIAREIEDGLDILSTNLRDFPEKHRSIRAVFAHSLALCTPEERTIFLKLSVFQGGFGREAAREVGGTSLSVMAALVDRSLLRVDHDGRYSLHELLRQFGAEQLRELPEEETSVRDRHGVYYLELMQRQWPRLVGREIKAALSKIRTELDNVRAAWDWAVTRNKAAEIEAAARSMWYFYGVTIHNQEGERVFAKAVSAFRDNTALCARLMARWGELTFLVGSYQQSQNRLEESLSLLRQVGAREETAFVLYRLVLISMNSAGTVSSPQDYLEESLAIYTELNDQFGIGEVQGVWGCYHLDKKVWNYALLGQSDGFHREQVLERAKHYFQESLAVHERAGCIFGIAYANIMLWTVAMLEEDFRRALEHAQISRKIFQELSIPQGTIQSLLAVSNAAYRLGDFEAARQAVLENMRFNYEHGLSRNQYGTHFITAIILNNVMLAAGILLAEDRTERGYELLALVDQQYRQFQLDADRSLLLHLLDEDLPLHLTKAVERGRTQDIETTVQVAIAELSSASASPLGAPHAEVDLLSAREMEIVQLIAEGLNSREVAERLVLSVTTVRWHLRQIYSKLDVHSRSELIACARALELLA